jgi:hypothetical protein
VKRVAWTGVLHNLKCHAENFDAIVSGAKRCEVRHEDDRTYAVGDRLCLVRTDVNGVATAPLMRTYVDVLHLTRHAGPLTLFAVDARDGARPGEPVAVVVMSIGAAP